MEMKTFKRLDETKVVLDGLVWGIDAEKAIEIKNTETGYKAHSIRIDSVYYYPYAIYVPKSNKTN